MATSGSCKTSSYDGRHLVFAWSVKSQSTADNKTIISWTLKSAGTASVTWYLCQNIKVTLDGKAVFVHTKAANGQIKIGPDTLVASGEHTFTHNNEGDCSFKAYVEAGIYNWAVNCTGSGTFDLPRIARASDGTVAADVTLGNPCSVKWTPAAASFRFRLKFSLGTWRYTTGAIHPNRTTAYTYTGFPIPLEVASQLPETKTGEMTVSLYTYSDSGATAQVGAEDTTTFTVTVPDNTDTKPAVTMAVEPVSALPDTFAGLYIQGLTRVKATLSAKEKYGSPIAGYQLKVDGAYYDYLDDLTSGYLAASGSRTVCGYATDKRGHTGEATKTITVLPYSAPKLENAEAFRCDQDGNASASGTCLKIQAKRSYTPVIVDGVQKNFCKIMYRYAEGAEYSDWTTILESSNLGTDEVITDALLDGALSATASYKVHIRAMDDIGRFADTYITISTDKVYMHKDGPRNAMGLGKYNERDNAVDSDWDFFMNGHKVTGLPAPTNSSDAVPKSYVDAADVKLSKGLTTMGWYKIGTVTGQMCAVVTFTIGGEYGNDDPSPSMVDVATQYNYSRAFLRLPALGDSQVSKLGLIQESAGGCGVYLYYNSTMVNTVKVNIHTHMGAFASAGFAASDVGDSNMIAVISLIE